MFLWEYIPRSGIRRLWLSFQTRRFSDRRQLLSRQPYIRHLIKQNGDIHSDWTGVKMDVDAYRKVVFEPYDLRVLDGVVDF